MTRLHSKAAILAHPCPHCRTIPGIDCRSTTNRNVRPHVQRINAAKRAASPGDCPACGMSLVTTKGSLCNTITHIGTGTFECGPTSEALADYLAGKTSR